MYLRRRRFGALLNNGVAKSQQRRIGAFLNPLVPSRANSDEAETRWVRRECPMAPRGVFELSTHCLTGRPRLKRRSQPRLDFCPPPEPCMWHAHAPRNQIPAFENIGHVGLPVRRLASLLARRMDPAPAFLHRDGGSRHRLGKIDRSLLNREGRRVNRNAAGKTPAALRGGDLRGLRPRPSRCALRPRPWWR